MRRFLIGSVLTILLLSLAARTARLSAQTAAIEPRTFAQLHAAALTMSDLPGYTLDYEGPGALDGSPVAFADYDALWIDSRAGSPHEFVSVGITALQFLDITDTPAALAIRYAGTHANVTLLGPQGIGNDDQVLFASSPNADGSSDDVYDIHFRRGMVLVDVLTVDQAGAGSLDQLLTLARAIDSRLQAASTAPAEAALAVDR